VGDKADSGFHLDTEEIIATIAVFALAGFFLWQQMGGRQESTAFAPGDIDALPESALSIEAGKPVLRADIVDRTTIASLPLRDAGAVSARSEGMACEPSATRGNTVARNREPSTTMTRLSECTVARPSSMDAGLDQGYLPGSEDEVILGGEPLVMESAAREVSHSGGGQVPIISGPVIDSVDFDQVSEVIGLTGSAPDNYAWVQVIVDGKRLEPVALDASGRWQQGVQAGENELYVQVVGMDAAGELILDEVSMPTVYVLSLKNNAQKGAGVVVLSGQLYQVNQGETLAGLARDFSSDRAMLARVNSITDRELVEGEVLFIPFTQP
jgi:LysM repeat protein